MADHGSRCLQGASVIIFYFILLSGTLFFCGPLFFYGLYRCFHFSWPLGFAYIAWWYLVDLETPNRGGRRAEFVRNNVFFRYMRDYFPVTLLKTTDLDSSKNYIFGYHPHGMFPDGLALSFGSEALQFSKIFPGIVPYIGAHSFMSRSPIFREIAMALGVINVHRDSCKFVLTQQGPGHSVVIAIGGTCDILNMNRDSYVITLERRKGFVQLALETGAHLVPVFAFGQNNVISRQLKLNGLLTAYHIGRSKWEKWIKVFLKSCSVLPYAQYCVMPYSTPITVVVGSPISVERVENPSKEQINKLHSEYAQKLRELFYEHRDVCGVPQGTELVIQ